MPQTDCPQLPPGQHLTTKWPVLTHGPTPRFDPATWDFRAFGAIEQPLGLSYPDFRALPRVTIVADFHCVPTWSRLNNRWEGVATTEIIASVRPKSECRFVLIHSEGGYTTNLSLEDFDADDVVLADRHDDADLTPEHGWPLRLVVPRLYAWKSAKWVRAVEFLSADQRGFWEVRGYHNHGDPWREERYTFQE